MNASTPPIISPTLRTILMHDEIMLESGVMHVAEAIDAGRLGWAAFEFQARNTLFNKLKTAIDMKKLPAHRLDDTGRAFKRTWVNLTDVWRFVRQEDETWEWLRDVCRIWMSVRGVSELDLDNSPISKPVIKPEAVLPANGMLPVELDRPGVSSDTRTPRRRRKADAKKRSEQWETYERINRILSKQWPNKHKRPEASIMATHVTATARQEKRPIKLAPRTIEQICDESYRAHSYVEWKNKRLAPS